MTARLRVFPRLPLAHARALCEEVIGAARDGGVGALTEMAAASHPQAAPVPTGGRIATTEEISTARDEVMASLEPWIDFGALQLRDGRSVGFDVQLGQALHESLRILPADAAHDGAWSFLSLVVFPDVVAYRFPELHPDRFLGRYPRNALRRVWFRQEVLGDLLPRARYPLGEDEATGLFERTALARNRRLARLLAIEVMSRPEQGRSVWARELYKRVTYATGPRMLDHLSDDQLQSLINEVVEGLSGEFPNILRLGADAWHTENPCGRDVVFTP